MEPAREIEVLIRAKYPILSIVSWEERRVEEAISKVCEKLGRKMHTWSITQGMKPTIAQSADNAIKLRGELEALVQVFDAPEYTVLVLRDFHPFLRDQHVIRLLRDLAAKLRGKAQTMILLSPVLSLPTELEKDVTVLEFPLPSEEEIQKKIQEISSAIKNSSEVATKLKPEESEILIKSAQGLTMDELESALARSLVEDKKFSPQTILEEKKQIVRKSGLLEYYPADSKMADVGGLDQLKKWLDQRKLSFTDKARDFGIPSPKGVLLLGVQGCGKSLVAKAIAAAWNLPMLKMDVGRIFGSLVGQSEENIRRAIQIAESVAPCVLWADELEKGFAGVGGSGVSDSGTTARVFATFLTWMQEKTKPVFLIATANDVSALPPELLRKGRFDEIFFVDLPGPKEREQIFSIHLSKRGRTPKKFKLAELSKLTEGYSGAEIEQVVIGALYHAFADGRELTFRDLKKEAGLIVPLSTMMQEDIAALREWAKLRTRPAH